MSQQPNDRTVSHSDSAENKEPRIYAIIDGKKFPRPGLETYFDDALTSEGTSEDSAYMAVCGCHNVLGVYCKCNKVRIDVSRCVPHCNCVGHTSSTRGSGGSYSTGTCGTCSCAPVH